MFYQCSKCQKKWQYPIKKCPHCFAELKRIKTQKAKIIGLSKTNIPTLLHPKTPYSVLVLEDEKGNRWTQKYAPHEKSSKEYQVGDEFILESIKDKNAVALWRIKYDILEAIERTVELIGSLDINQDSRIVVLPTLTSPKHPHFAENTSPEFLEGLLLYLFQKGIKAENIKVAGQSFTDIPIEASIQKSQLLRVCRDFKISPLDLAKTNFVKKEKEGLVLELSEELFNNNLIINLPILKMGKALASENVLKFLKKENYLGLKYLHEKEKIIKTLKDIMPQCLTIAEAHTIQKPDKFTVFLGMILTSFDFLNLDRIFFEITCQEKLPRILEKIEIEKIPVLGRTIEEIQYEVGKL